MENSTEVKNVNLDSSNANLITCEICGAQMAKSAKKCPSCGGKNKAKSKKKLIVIGIIILIIVVSRILSPVIDNIRLNNLDYEKGYAAAMLQEHRSNEAAANEKYSGKAYYFVGIVDTISSSEIDVCVGGDLVVVGATHRYGGEQLNCTLGELKNADYFYENVKEGSTVIIKGVIDDMWNGHINMDAYYIELYKGEYEYTYVNIPI